MATLLRRKIIFHLDSRLRFWYCPLIASPFYTHTSNCWLTLIHPYQEHEDILSQASQDEGAEDLNDTNEGPEELNEDLLDDEEEEDDEKSWKRRNNEDD